MKTKIISSHILFISSLAGIAFTCLMGYSPWLIAGFLVIAFLASVFTFRAWMKYVAGIMAASNKTLNKKEEETSAWSFDNLENIQQNQKLIEKKFQLSAELISNLSNPETMGANHGLLENDAIGIALQNIRAEMLRIKDEDDKRAWISQGLASFGETLRNKAEVKEYSYKIISHLVKYIRANQGGIFIEYTDPENRRYLELTGCYAYEKRRYTENKIYEGEGLLGQCMQEKDFIFITDVPKEYVKITSGLGLATPRNIVIAPLIFNETFCGAIELASFEVLQPHQMEFLRKICESIASEIVSLKNIQHTQTLLTESNVLTQELQSREEEMKQNLEELAATQEEMARKQAELSGIVNAIDKTLATAEFDLAGKFKSANDIFMKVMGYGEGEVHGKYFDFFMGDEQSAVMMWENLRLGKFFSGEFKMKDKAGKELWLSGTFNPIIVKGNVPEKIIMFAQFTTQEKDKLNDLNGMVHALKHTLPVMEFNEHFACKTLNEMAMKLFGVSRMELRKKTVLDFIEPYYHLAWKKKQSELLEHEFSNFLLPMITGKQATTYEVSASIIKNMEGEVTKVIILLVKEVNERVSVLAAV